MSSIISIFVIQPSLDKTLLVATCKWVVDPTSYMYENHKNLIFTSRPNPIFTSHWTSKSACTSFCDLQRPMIVRRILSELLKKRVSSNLKIIKNNLPGNIVTKLSTGVTFLYRLATRANQAKNLEGGGKPTCQNTEHGNKNSIIWYLFNMRIIFCADSLTNINSKTFLRNNWYIDYFRI